MRFVHAILLLSLCLAACTGGQKSSVAGNGVIYDGGNRWGLAALKDEYVQAAHLAADLHYALQDVCTEDLTSKNEIEYCQGFFQKVMASAATDLAGASVEVVAADAFPASSDSSGAKSTSTADADARFLAATAGAKASIQFRTSSLEKMTEDERRNLFGHEVSHLVTLTDCAPFADCEALRDRVGREIAKYSSSHIRQGTPGAKDPYFLSVAQRFNAGLAATVQSVLELPDGSLVVLGAQGPSATSQLVVSKLTNSGKLDETFGNGGQAVLTGFTMSIGVSALWTGDAICIAGGAKKAAGSEDMLVACFSPTGEAQWATTYDFAGATDLAMSVVLTTSKTLVAVGLGVDPKSGLNHALYLELDVSGKILKNRDFQFGTGQTSFQDAVISRGSVCAAGDTWTLTGAVASNVKLFALCFQPDGTPRGDPLRMPHDGDNYGWSISEWQGELVLSGMAVVNGQQVAAIYRFDAAGKPSSMWGDRGRVVASFPGSAAFLRTRARDDGGVMAVGTVGQNSQPKLLVAKYTSNGSLDASWNVGGVVIDNSVGQTSGGGLCLQRDGKLLVGMNLLGPDGQSSVVLNRYFGSPFSQ